MNYGRLIFKSFLSLSFCFICVSSGFAVVMTHTSSYITQVPCLLNNKQFSYLKQRLTGWGFWDVTNTEGIIKGDFFVPLSKESKMPFLNIQGERYDGNSGMLGAGLGYRQLDKSYDRIWGGYLFGDYSSIDNHHFWVINPGIESLGKEFDFRGNVYIPLGNKKDVSDKYWDESGDYVSFKEHEQYNRLYYKEIGFGVDGEIGFNVKRVDGLQAFLGGYYFVLDQDMGGVSGRLNYAMNDHLALDLRASYDNKEEATVLAGLEISLGGIYHSLRPSNMMERIEDPIERQLGVLSGGTSIPVVKNKKQALERDHIWFFDGEKTSDGAGTYKNPFQASEYGNDKVNYIHGKDPDYSHLYFNKGIYDAGEAVTIHNNQSMWGRTQDYTLAANHGGRPVIQEGLILEGNNIIDSLLFRNNPVDIGIDIKGSHVLLNNVEVGQLNNHFGYKTGVKIGNNLSDIIIKNSTIRGYRSGTPGSDGDIQATGIYLGSGSELEVENSEIEAQAIADGGSDKQNGVAYGIHAEGQGNTIVIKDSDIDVKGSINTETDSTQHGGNAYGILIGTNYNDSDLTISNNNLLIKNSDIKGVGNSIAVNNSDDNANYKSSTGNGTGVFIGSGYNDDANITISNNTLDIQESDLIGKGNSTAEASGESSKGNSYSSVGNGTGFLIGSGYNYNSSTDISSSIDISSNTLDIQGSELIGTGNSTAEASGESSKGNSYSSVGNGTGFLIGSGYNYNSGSTDISSSIDISSNTLDIQGSDLIGTGNSTVETSGESSDGNFLSIAGNGTGLLVGSGYNYEKLSIANISNNIFTIQKSDLIGTGNSKSEAKNRGNYISDAGSGIGLLVGSWYNNNGGETSIRNNTFTIQESGLIGTGNSTVEAEDNGNNDSIAGNGIGLLIGSSYNNDTSSIDILSNILTIQGSNLIGTGNLTVKASNYGNFRSITGDGTGLLIGSWYNGYSSIDISSNTLDIQESDLVGTGNSTVESGDKGNNSSSAGNGTGLLIGSSYNNDVSSIGISSNILTIQESDLIGTGNSTVKAGDKGNDDSIAGNGIGLLIGSGYNNSTSSINISSNTLDIQESDLIGTGNSTVEAEDDGNDNSIAGNGTGFLIGSGYNYNSSIDISSNTLDIQGSDLIGTGNSTVETSKYGNFLSIAGNGTGLLVGSGYNYEELSIANISNNTFTIQKSDLIGTGNSKSEAEDRGNHVSDAGNGIGLLIGSWYNNNGGETNIKNNTFTVQESGLIGTGNSTAEASGGSSKGNNDSIAGNGIGLLIGSAYNNDTSSINISSNILTIRGSDLIGTGNSTAEASGGSSEGNLRSITGDGTGLLIGSWYSSSSSVDISSNTLDIQESDLAGTGNSTAEASSKGNNDSIAGNGTGLLIGSGYNSESSIDISDNTLTIQSSSLTGMGDATSSGGDTNSSLGNSIGLLVGTGYQNEGSITVTDNTIDVEESEFYAKADDNEGILASGILIGSAETSGSPSETISGNNLTVLRSHFDIDGGDGDGYGILMKGTGTLTRLLNTFLGVHVGSGKKVKAPSDTLNWGP